MVWSNYDCGMSDGRLLQHYIITICLFDVKPMWNESYLT